MADIQQVRYDYPTQPAPGFMDYAAQFVTGFTGAKEKKAEKRSKELMALLPAIAAQGQLKKGGQIDYAGMNLGIGPRPTDYADALNRIKYEQKTSGELDPEDLIKVVGRAFQETGGPNQDWKYTSEDIAREAGKMGGAYRLFNKGESTTPSPKVKRATKPMNISGRNVPLTATYKGQTVYLGVDGMYHTEDEIE